MKVEVKKIEKTKQFEPFELIIKVETLDEARELWHRFNKKDLKLAGIIEEDSHNYPGMPMTSIWKLIEEQIEPFEK